MLTTPLLKTSPGANSPSARSTSSGIACIAARDPRFFGQTGLFRFDAPAAEYGVLCMARSHEGAFIETFGSVIRDRHDRHGLFWHLNQWLVARIRQQLTKISQVIQ